MEFPKITKWMVIEFAIVVGIAIAGLLVITDYYQYGDKICTNTNRTFYTDKGTYECANWGKITSTTTNPMATNHGLLITVVVGVFLITTIMVGFDKKGAPA